MKGREKHFNLQAFFETDFVRNSDGGFRPLSLAQLPFAHPEIVVTENTGLVLETLVESNDVPLLLTGHAGKGTVLLGCRAENIIQNKSSSFQLQFCFLC